MRGSGRRLGENRGWHLSAPHSAILCVHVPGYGQSETHSLPPTPCAACLVGSGKLCLPQWCLSPPPCSSACVTRSGGAAHLWGSTILPAAVHGSQVLGRGLTYWGCLTPPLFTPLSHVSQDLRKLCPPEWIAQNRHAQTMRQEHTGVRS